VGGKGIKYSDIPNKYSVGSTVVYDPSRGRRTLTLSTVGFSHGERAMMKLLGM